MPAPASLDLITKLISYDTTSRDSNLALIDFVRDYLSSYRIDSYLSFDETGRKANLFATIGPNDRGGIVLSGHTDVVPVDGQPWTADPFTVRTLNDTLVGRGTSDMKSFIAVALAAVPDLVTRDLKTPIHLAFTYDEEVGCLGARTLLADLAARDIHPRACIIGEPTLMTPVTAHKGKKSVRCHVHGVECHSALAHEGVNAVEAAAELIAYLKGMARRHRDNGPFDTAFTPPYTTVHTGKINGGTALNIVPKDCVFDFEFRYLPGESSQTLFAEVVAYANSLLPEMQRISPDTGFQFEELSGFDGLNMPDDHPLTRLVQQVSGANGTGKVSFGTEGGLFQHAGIPTIICGPGSIEQAHKPDEWIALDQIDACENFIARLSDHAMRAAA